jgi:hypothetical protein
LLGREPGELVRLEEVDLALFKRLAHVARKVKNR